MIRPLPHSRNAQLLALALLIAAPVLAQNQPPAAPPITEPRIGRIVNPSDAHMEAGPFSDPNPADTHVCTDWEIWQAAPLERVWFTACIAGVERVHTHLGDGVFEGPLAGRRTLDANTNYLLRVRFRDSSGEAATEWSAWSERAFLTGELSTLFPLEIEDVLAAPAPTLRTPLGAPVALPGGAPPATIRVEVLDPAGPSFGLALEIAGSAGGNVQTNPPPLPEHGAVRAIVFAGSAGLDQSEADLTFTTDDGEVRTIFLPPQALAPGASAYYWVSANGGAYAATPTQTAPDFSTLVRGPAVPWTAAADVRVEIVATGFQLPVNIAFVPNPGADPHDPLYYVAELYGEIKVVLRDGHVEDYATGLLNFNPTGNFPGSGEQGLAGVVVDPSNGDVYATLLYSTNPGDDNAPHHPRVVRFTSNDGGRTAATQTTILDMAPEQQGQSHQISNISFGPDDALYVHMGDGFDAGSAQNPSRFRGKILRMNRSGQPLPTNPFYNAGDGINATDYIYALGVRNPFGGAWRASDAAHYFVENGPSVDRFARLVEARNYGYDGSDESMRIFALYNWDPASAPVNIAFIQPETFGGSGFPGEYFGRAYVTQSGGTFAGGPGSPYYKSITEWIIDANGDLVSGGRSIAYYNGGGQSSAVAIAAGPDGLYFSDFYREHSPGNPIARGANILRIRYAPPPPPPDCNDNGVPDADDILAGTSQDCNGNAIPDECDIANATSDDCNGNSVPDDCEIAVPLLTDFDDGLAGDFVLNGTAVVSGGSLVLTPADFSVIGTANRPPLALDPMTSFRVTFDFRIGGGSGADGLCFSAFDAALYTVNQLYSEEGPGTLTHEPAGPGSITVQFDTYDNDGEGENAIELQYNGATLATYTPTFDMEDDLVHRAEIIFRDNRVTVRVTDALGAVETAHAGVLVPGYTPFVALFGFAGRTGGATNVHTIDNVAFYVPGPADANQNGVLDVCECPGARGDANCDGAVDFFDIDPFLLALFIPNQYAATYCDGLACAVDVDCSGGVDFFDIDGFIACLFGGCAACP